MRSFKDGQGRDWTIEVTIDSIKRVRDLAKVDLYSLFTTEAQRLFSDPVLLVDALYVLCHDQVSSRQMSDIDFGKLFAGDVLEQAAGALLEATVDFFPESRRRILRATIDKSQAMGLQLQERAMETIEAITIAQITSPSPGVSPA